MLKGFISNISKTCTLSLSLCYSYRVSWTVLFKIGKRETQALLIFTIGIGCLGQPVCSVSQSEKHKLDQALYHQANLLPPG